MNPLNSLDKDFISSGDAGEWYPPPRMVPSPPPEAGPGVPGPLVPGLSGAPQGLQWDQYNSAGPRVPGPGNSLHPMVQMQLADELNKRGFLGSPGIPPTLGLQGRPAPTLGR